MALPHLCHQKRYQDFFQTLTKREYVILDNGAAEEVTFGAQHLHTLADVIGAKEIVVPDTLFEFRQTLGQALQFGQIADPKYRYMAVVQGRTYQEFQKCLEAYLTMPALSYITTIGIPRLMNTIDDSMRYSFVQWIKEESFLDVVEYHALGSTNDLREVYDLWTEGIVRGIDTSAPIHMGLAGIDITQNPFPPKRPSDYFETYRIEHEDIVDKNIKTYLEWASYEYTPPSS